MRMAALIALFAVPVIALGIITGLAAAYSFWKADGLSPEEKIQKIQALELRKGILQDMISYLNGEIPEEQFEERMEESMQKMHESGEEHGCPMMSGSMHGGMGMHGMGF